MISWEKKIAQREPLSIDLIREIHGILTAGTYDERRFIVNNERPGQFKIHDYVIGRHEAGLPPKEVEPALSELFDELNDDAGSDILKAAAYLHVKFEHIHPFADGNGRVGRTLMNYWLMTHREPPVIVFEEDRKSYYDALERYDADEVIEPMVKFLRAETIKTWKKAIERDGSTE